jgi:hypothetical protein
VIIRPLSQILSAKGLTGKRFTVDPIEASRWMVIRSQQSQDRLTSIAFSRSWKFEIVLSISSRQILADEHEF